MMLSFQQLKQILSVYNWKQQLISRRSLQKAFLKMLCQPETLSTDLTIEAWGWVMGWVKPKCVGIYICPGTSSSPWWGRAQCHSREDFQTRTCSHGALQLSLRSALLVPLLTIILPGSPCYPVKKSDEWGSGKLKLRLTNQFLLLLPNRISLKFPSKMQGVKIAGFRIWKSVKDNLLNQSLEKHWPFNTAYSWMCLPLPPLSGLYGYVKDAWETYLERQGKSL